MSTKIVTAVLTSLVLASALTVSVNAAPRQDRPGYGYQEPLSDSIKDRTGQGF